MGWLPHAYGDPGSISLARSQRLMPCVVKLWSGQKIIAGKLLLAWRVCRDATMPKGEADNSVMPVESPSTTALCTISKGGARR